MRCIPYTFMYSNYNRYYMLIVWYSQRYYKYKVYYFIHNTINFYRRQIKIYKMKRVYLIIKGKFPTIVSN